MTGYHETFGRLKRTALIPFFVIGDPTYEQSLELVKTALDAGADILELGIPFSDPIADGPTIQKADLRSLAAGMTPAKALQFIGEIAAFQPVPIGLLVYYNLIVQYGTERFCRDFKEAGGTSILVADLSIDDADEMIPAVEAAGLETVFMITPNTPEERIDAIAAKTTGFLYTVSRLGTTGERNDLSDSIRPLIARIKRHTNKPICVGFGISSAEHARQVANAGADGVIIGSRIVKCIEENLCTPERIAPAAGRFIAGIKAALEAAPSGG